MRVRRGDVSASSVLVMWCLVLAGPASFPAAPAVAAAERGDDGNMGALSSAQSAAGSAQTESSAADSRSVTGGRFQSQPLNFPASVNQGPGWKVPVGPYRPLPPVRNQVKKPSSD